MKLYEKQNQHIRIASYSLNQLAICATATLLSSGILLALISYDAKDTSWFFVRSHAGPVHNMLGRFGANLAGLLMYLWGSAAFVIPLTLSFMAFFAIKGIAWKKEADRLIACCALLIALSALLHSYAIDPFYLAAPGGIMGALVYKVCTLLADAPIVFLTLHVIIFVCCVLLTRLAWVGPLRMIARGTQSLINEHVQQAALQYFARISLVITRFLQNVVTFCVGIFKMPLRLFSGKAFVEHNDVVPLEFGQLVQEVVNDTTDTTFWRTAQGYSLDMPKETEAQVATNEHFVSTQLATELREIHVPAIAFNDASEQRVTPYAMPNPLQFGAHKQEKQSADDQALHEMRARMLEQKLARFGITGHVVAIKPGPVITLFEYEPDIDSKVSKILALEDDLAMALEAVSIRIIAPIPGRSVVGFEVANKDRAVVPFSAITHSKAYAQCSGALPLILGDDIVGNPVIVDLADMPHLLVAGSTGSGKSVALNTMLMSLLFKCTPQQLRLILIDPKRLEFASYADIGHLLFPIVTDPKTASPVLQWVVRTMEDRYELMATVGVRNHQAYQRLCASQNELEPMPYIVVMIDELSDLMMTAGKEVEALIARIAQMARAAGIHMIVATQRPSVDVITGLIKVNFPSRISFRVISKVDSRTILDCVGAEKLLGKGDMLFLSAASSLMRVHGAYVSHAEISKLVEYIRAQQPPHYLDIQEELPLKKGSLLDADDTLYEEVIGFVKSTDQISISLLQRRFRIGYNRSARIMETLEADGHIMPSDGSKMRKVIK